ncbi:MAG: amylo-alpha-1,6-glucosidase [Rhizobiales bacterium]|nr:amylo-alpha-1,6-glucosidase [Hyphomicrobiales bacterium]
MSTEGVSRSGHLAEETPFYIPATTDSATRARRTLKHGDCFAILDSHGDIGASPGAPDGIYFHDTRFLSRLELLINGFQPLLLGSNLRDDDSVLTVDLTNPDMYFEKRLVLPKDTVHIVRTIFLWRGTAHQRLSLRNHGERAVSLNLSFTFGSDFADLFEVRGMRREHRGRLAAPSVNGADVLLAYEGLDKVQRQTRLFFDPAPDQLGASAASYRIQLAPHESRTLFLTATCDAPEFEPMSFNRSLLGYNRELREVTRGSATVTTSNTLFNEVLCRSMSDLYMLMTQTPDGPYPYAGTPYYSTTFGRDGLITAMQMLWFDPKVAAGVLRRLARLQATADNAASDAQPGKILHEMRGGEMAALGEVPFALYYGSVDSTPLFVMLAGLYAQRTGDWQLIEALWPHIEAALGWIEGPADPDGDGFLEYARATEQGLANQGWKDSFDAVFHAAGTLAEGPVALSEVQGYVFAAKRLAAMCARRLGHDVRAAELEASAAQLAQKFEDAFWCPEIGTYALALDGKKQPCKVRTSNAGQVLFSGIASAEHARKVGRGLLGSDFFSGWGIRTVAREAPRYNPMSYHNGSVWPHDNALIAAGLARYGMKAEVNQVFGGLFDAATYMDLRRLPELFCGFKRRAGEGPTLYPVACAPQAWASGTPFMLLQAALGLEFDPDAREIRLRNPRLPAFLPEVTLHNLRLGEAKITLALHRHGEGVGIQTLNAEGAVRVSTILD